MAGEFELKPHTADVAIEATGPTYDAVFGALGDGLAAAHVDELPKSGARTLSVTITAESRTALLFDYLDRLIYIRDVEAVLPVNNVVSIEEAGGKWTLEGEAEGVPLTDLAAREVKAITYSEMELEERDGTKYGYVVVDV